MLPLVVKNALNGFVNNVLKFATNVMNNFANSVQLLAIKIKEI